MVGEDVDEGRDRSKNLYKGEEYLEHDRTQEQWVGPRSLIKPGRH